MISSSGRHVITFNGEIYNHLHLRDSLEEAGLGPVAWRGHSDTETLLACIEAWGLERALQAFRGMFALGVWDQFERTLWLACDRLGEKPLYYGMWGGAFAFASELTAFSALSDERPELEPAAVGRFMSTGYIPAPLTIYRGVHKLRPGHLLRLCEDDLATGALVSRPYWTLSAAASGSRFDGSPTEAVHELRRLLGDAIALQMMGDVPVGAFLSGGIDSTAIVALMQEHSRTPVKTFSIGFEEAAFDESHHAAQVARHLGTNHAELIVTGEDALELVPRLPAISGEPFADSSQIPTALLAALTRQQVTVSLSGDGGDELFGGYTRYFRAAKLERVPAKAFAGHVLSAATPRAPGRWPKRLEALGLTARRARTIANVLQRSTSAERYLELLYQSRNYSLLCAPDTAAATAPFEYPRGVARDLLTELSLIDAATYLPGDVLAKVDRAAMASSLETRVPMLDHPVVEFAFRVPEQIKLRDGVSKWPLRELAYSYVPRTLLDRPKMGFGVPVAAWLRGPLRRWAQDLLASDDLRRDEHLNEPLISTLLREHLAGEQDWSTPLWRLLMYRAWRGIHA